MRVEKLDTDYYIYLTMKEVKEVCSLIKEGDVGKRASSIVYFPDGKVKERRLASFLDVHKYPWLFAPINFIHYAYKKYAVLDKYLSLTATRNAVRLHGEYSHDNIYFRYNDIGEPTVMVYPPIFKPLVEGTKKEVGTRYNVEDKILFTLE